MPHTPIINTLSPSRMSTYLNATNQDQAKALELYIWNSQISAALLVPMHLCEITIRNTVARALETQFNVQWPWARSLELTLPKYFRAELIKARNQQDVRNRASKVIPELTFNFWQQMFVTKYDQQFWQPYLHTLLPNAPANMPVDQLRASIFNDLDKIRKLRNRIAHHEPIFKQDLNLIMNKIERLIYFRCSNTSDWATPYYQVQALLQVKP